MLTGNTKNTKGERIKEHIRDHKKAVETRIEKLQERDKQYKKLETTRTRYRELKLNELKQKHQNEDENTTYSTALLSHAMKKNHEFDFDKTKKLMFENDRQKRKAYESMYIVREGYYACNFKTDTQFVNLNNKQIIHAHNYQKRKAAHTSNFN